MSPRATDYKETNKGLKITARMHSWGQLWTTRYKQTKIPTATSEVSGAKARYCAWSLHTAPPRGWADHLSHASGLTPGSAPTLTPLTAPARPASGSDQGKLLLVFAPSCCLNFLSGIINFYWLRSPRTLVGNNTNINYQGQICKSTYSGENIS